ncbi:acyltransferase [Paenibacillus hodogayensis]
MDLFFVLSGFIFMHVYSQRIKEKRISFKEYGILRLSRLYPLHIVTLVIVSIIQFIRSLELNNFFIYQYNDVYHFVLNIFFLQHGWFDYGFSFNAPTWSISVEIVAYILLFIVLFKFPTSYNYLLVTIILIGLSITKMKLSLPLLNDGMGRVFIGFFVGCCTFEVNKLLNSQRLKKLAACISLFLLVVLFIIGFFIGHYALGNWPIVYTVVVFPLIVIMVLNLKFLTRILSLKPITYLGDISYSIYLWHFPVQLLIKTTDDILKLSLDYSSRVVYLSIVIITLVVSSLSHEFFEKPVLKFLRKTKKT